MDAPGFEIDFAASGLPDRQMNLREVGRLLGMGAVRVKQLFEHLEWLDGRGKDWPTARALMGGLVVARKGAAAGAEVRWSRRVVIRELEARGYDLALPPTEYLRLATDRLLVEFRQQRALSPATPIPPPDAFCRNVSLLPSLLAPVRGPSGRGAFLAALSKALRAKGVQHGHFEALVERAGLAPEWRAFELAQALPTAPAKPRANRL